MIINFSKNAKNILNNKASYLNVSLIGTNLSNILASSFFTLYFINLIEKNKDELTGDFLELGVFQGHSLIFFDKFLDKKK